MLDSFRNDVIGLKYRIEEQMEKLGVNNISRNEMDILKGLTFRGHDFVKYFDTCNPKSKAEIIRILLSSKYTKSMSKLVLELVNTTTLNDKGKLCLMYSGFNDVVHTNKIYKEFIEEEFNYVRKNLIRSVIITIISFIITVILVGCYFKDYNEAYIFLAVLSGLVSLLMIMISLSIMGMKMALSNCKVNLEDAR